MQIRCPHCHQPIELVDDDPSGDVTCSSCGSRFNLEVSKKPLSATPSNRIAEERRPSFSQRVCYRNEQMAKDSVTAEAVVTAGPPDAGEARPVKRGFVNEPLHWRWTSARNYARQPSLIDVVTDWM